jgi:hypothetical protein
MSLSSSSWSRCRGAAPPCERQAGTDHPRQVREAEPKTREGTDECRPSRLSRHANRAYQRMHRLHL